ncbi:MAG: lecithin--cholesterol acyltransferase [Actinomycetota bacterium]
MAKKRLRDVVVLLPGITGSVLQKDGHDVWATTGAAAWRAIGSLGGSIRDLALGDDDPEADDLGDGIRATRLVSDAHLVPGLVKIDGYTATARMITESFEVLAAPGQPSNFIEFPYDWRRDNRVAARALKRRVEDELKQWRDYCGARDARVILLAHSMGGLVARYYLEVLEGWRDCRALVTFGTPYRGSINAVEFIANGYKKGLLDMSELMRSLTSVYQLLPIYPALKTATGFQRIAETAGVPGVDQARAEAALRFHREIENAVSAHRKDDDYLNNGYRILPVIGTHQPTRQSALLADGRLTVSSDLPDGVDEALGDGDGTVPRASAIPIELSEEYRDTFVAERHAMLHCNPGVLIDLQGRLEQMQVTGLAAVRGPTADSPPMERVAIAVELDDVYATGEPVEIRARMVNPDPHGARLETRVAAVDERRPVAATYPMQPDNDRWVVQIADLPPGVYRVAVGTAGSDRVSPSDVHDLFEVAG